MSNKEREAIHQIIHQGLGDAQRQILREKALRNETIVRCAPDGTYYEQSARQALAELYNEEVR